MWSDQKDIKFIQPRKKAWFFMSIGEILSKTRMYKKESELRIKENEALKKKEN